MKNSTIKMKFVVIVSGLALLLCCSLKCHAQTDDWGIYGVYYENGKIIKEKSKFYDGFRGDYPTCKKKCDDLNARKPTTVSIADKVGDKINEMAQSDFGNKPVQVTVEETRPKAREEEANFTKIVTQLRDENGMIHYEPRRVSPLTELISNDMYNALADKVVYVEKEKRGAYMAEIIVEMDPDDRPGWYRGRYNELCVKYRAKYGCVYNEKDFQTFYNELEKRVKALSKEYHGIHE